MGERHNPAPIDESAEAQSGHWTAEEMRTRLADAGQRLGLSSDYLSAVSNLVDSPTISGHIDVAVPEQKSRAGRTVKVLRLAERPTDGDNDWSFGAACRDIENPDIFFVERGSHDRHERAKAICQKCPVITQCLEWAMKNNETFGVWGGMSDREREFMRRSEKS